MGPRRLTTGLLVSAAASVVAAVASAQVVNYTHVEAITGQPLQLTYHASAHKSDCTAAPLATINVLLAPDQGVLTVRRAELMTEKVTGCPHLKIPAQVVFYTGHENYAGPDHLSYEVTNFNGEDDATFDVTITVKPAAAPDGAAGKQNSP
jgi:hypothetical protein